MGQVAERAWRGEASVIATRRGFIRSLGLVGAAAAVTGLLSACGGGLPTTSVSSGSTPAARTANLPAYVPVAGPAPQLPGTTDGLDPGFDMFPTQLFQSVPSAPGKGGDVTIATWLTTPPLTPFEQNAMMQEVNRQLNANVKLTLVPFADYQQTRFAAMVAGSDLPDVFFVPPRVNVQDMPTFLQKQAADLTPYLSGDAVKDYPNLANIPTFSWKTTTFSGRIYGVPVPSGWYSAAVFVHQEYLDQIGATPPTTAEDFKNLCLQLTRPDENRWAIAIEEGVAYGVGESFIPAIFKAPNNWRLDSNGKLTRSYETPEYKAAVAFASDLVTAGVFSLSNNNVASKQEFQARKGVMRFDGWGAWGLYWDSAAQQQPPGQVRSLRPFSNDGSPPAYYLGTGSFGFTAIKNASDDRIRELLGILNFLAAPFGSQEWLLLNFGVKDVDFAFDQDGNPRLAPQGQNDVKEVPPWRYITQPPPVLYRAGAPNFPNVVQEDEKAMLAAGVADPTVGYYSAADAATGIALTQKMNDGINDIVAGRRPASDFDQMVSDWRSGGGDQIRGEYEAAIGGA